MRSLQFTQRGSVARVERGCDRIPQEHHPSLGERRAEVKDNESVPPEAANHAFGERGLRVRGGGAERVFRNAVTSEQGEAGERLQRQPFPVLPLTMECADSIHEEPQIARRRLHVVPKTQCERAIDAVKVILMMLRERLGKRAVRRKSRQWRMVGGGIWNRIWKVLSRNDDAVALASPSDGSFVQSREMPTRSNGTMTQSRRAHSGGSPAAPCCTKV